VRRRWSVILLLLGAPGATGIAAIWVITKPRPAFSRDAEAALRGGDPARGELIFAAGDCASCHASPGQSDRLQLGGGMALASAYGTFRVPNISTDPVDGIGRWETVDLANALLSGVSVAKSLAEDIDTPEEARDVVQLITLRSNGQFNTTIYNYDDRFRGIYGSRHVVLMHQNDIDRFELKEGELVALNSAVDDGVERKVDGFRVVAYDIPEGCIAGYYPECNPLLPLWHHEEKSKTPAAKSIPVRVQRQMERA
jgi:mono/diheme cytochrome c family protein